MFQLHFLPTTLCTFLTVFFTTLHLDHIILHDIKSYDMLSQNDEHDFHLEEAKRRFRHVAIKRLVTKIADYGELNNKPALFFILHSSPLLFLFDLFIFLFLQLFFLFFLVIRTFLFFVFFNFLRFMHYFSNKFFSKHSTIN